MADTAVIGALRAILGADTAQFEDALKKSQKAAERWSDKVATIAKGIGLERIVERMADSIVHSFKEMIESADKLGKMAQKVGLPVEEFSGLRVAAELADVSLESLSAGLGKLAKSMVAAAEGNAEAEAGFKRLGIEIKNADGSLKTQSQVLGEVSDKFEHMTDGAQKVAAAIAIFGKGGKDLIPLLNDGSGSIKEWTEAAKKMGLVVTGEMFQNSQRLNDNIKILSLAWEGQINIIIAGLLPALVKLSNGWVDAAKSGEAATSIATKVVEGVKKESEEVGKLATTWEKIKEAGKLVRDIDFSDPKGPQKQWERVKSIILGLPADWRKAEEEIRGAFKPEDFVGPIRPKEDIEANAKLIKSIEDTTFKTKLLRHEFDSFAIGAPEALKAAGISTEQLQKGVGGLSGEAQKLNAEMLLLQQAKLTEENLAPWQTFELQMQRLNQAFPEGERNILAYKIAAQKAADAAGMSWKTAGTSIAQSFTEIANSAGDQFSTMAKTAKVFAAVVALISAYEGSATALAGPFPANLVAAAAVLAKGFALYAAIKSTAIPGAAEGGSFKVPGGYSARDNVVVPMRLASGEKIDVTPASDVARGRGGNVQEITLQGIRPNDLFTGDMIRGLFDALNAGSRDGYRLNVAT